MRRLAPFALCFALLAAAPAQAQLGLRPAQPLPDNWMANFEFASRDAGDSFQRFALRALAGRQFDSGLGIRFGEQQLDLGFQPGGDGGIAVPGRLQWSYLFGQRASVGLAWASGYEAEANGAEARGNLTLFGRYWITPSWAFSAEAVAHEPGGLQPRRALRFGLRHRF